MKYGGRKCRALLSAPCLLFENVCNSRATSLRPVGFVALDLAESHQTCIRGVALTREPPKLQQA